MIRSLYDTAALTGKTCRLVFELPASKGDDSTPIRYRAECASGNLTTERNRDDVLKEENKENERRARDPRSRTESATGSFGLIDMEPTLKDVLSREKDRVDQSTKFSNFTSPEIEPRELPVSVRLSLWTRHQREAVSTGTAYIYFFPQGFAERAMVFVKQGSNTWTLSVAPLTGKTSVVAEELEVPRS